MSVLALLKRTILYKYYHEYNIRREKKHEAIRNKFFMKEGEELLVKFSSAMNRAEIPFWLEFGSLLGFFREKDFIKHDYDIDFGAFLNDRKRVRKALEDVGFKLILLFEASDGGFEECYKYKNTSVDVFYFREDVDTYYCNTFIGRYPRIVDKFLRPKRCLVKRIDIPKQAFVKTTFKGADVYVPQDCVKHLEMHYGKTFMTPNPNFSFQKEATNIIYYTYEECKGVMYEYEEK